MKEQVKQLLEKQLRDWPLAKANYKALGEALTKTVYVDGRVYRVQFNPARIVSSAAQIDAASIRARRCFLCGANRPTEQKGILFRPSGSNNRYTILVNPYPIFPRHLTIPSDEHTPQRIDGRFGDMLELARQLDDYVVFYNGAQCGASAPDHFHFQAGNKGFLPIETNAERSNAVRLVSSDMQELIADFHSIYEEMPQPSNGGEPMINLLAWHNSGVWTVCVFKRRKHRPACYSADGDAQMLISPGAVDMGGVFITPLEKDFLKITANDIAEILAEV